MQLTVIDIDALNLQTIILLYSENHVSLDLVTFS